jgi:hypothetical protein
MVSAASIPVVVIALYDSKAPPREDDLVQMMHQTNYTTRICMSLERLIYFDLYSVILEMADPAITDVRQRQACHDAVDSLNLEFAAAEGAVKYYGDNLAKSTVGRFMLAREAALGAFAPAVPPGTILTAIAHAIATAEALAAGTIADLQKAIIDLPDSLTTGITLGSVTGWSDDDNARNFIAEANSQNWVPQIASRIKVHAMDSCLTGWTGGDDEIAVNTILRTSKGYDEAECYQLAAAATWSMLYGGIDGENYLELRDVILSQP